MKNFYTISALFLFLTGGLTAQVKSTTQGFIDDQAPIVSDHLSNHQAIIGEANAVIDLSAHFTDPDDAAAVLAFVVETNSYQDVAALTIADQDLTIDYLAAGQTTVIISASNNGLSASDTFLIGVTPSPESDFTGDIETINFDQNTLDAESYWNGSDLSGEFTSGSAHFTNSYNESYASWSGWAYSNTSDITTAGFTNQYSAITGSGFGDGADNYGVSYTSMGASLYFEDSAAHELLGFYVTNATYATLSMVQGDAYTKKFGGVDGTEEDWLKLTITGKKEGADLGTVDFLLADFSSSDKSKDYIIQTWQWVDLSSLGAVDALSFAMSSTDNSDWGMNTPAYFCMDNFLIIPNDNPVIEQNSDLFSASVYPNPSAGRFTIGLNGIQSADITVYDLSGRRIFSLPEFQSGSSIDLQNQKAGTYILTIKSGVKISHIKIIKQ